MRAKKLRPDQDQIDGASAENLPKEALDEDEIVDNPQKFRKLNDSSHFSSNSNCSGRQNQVVVPSEDRLSHNSEEKTSKLDDAPLIEQPAQIESTQKCLSEVNLKPSNTPPSNRHKSQAAQLNPLQDIAEMQANMALMEAHGRQEEYVTSADNLDRDEQNYEEWQRNNAQGANHPQVAGGEGSQKEQEAASQGNPWITNKYRDYVQDGSKNLKGEQFHFSMGQQHGAKEPLQDTTGDISHGQYQANYKNSTSMGRQGVFGGDSQLSQTHQHDGGKTSPLMGIINDNSSNQQQPYQAETFFKDYNRMNAPQYERNLRTEPAQSEPKPYYSDVLKDTPAATADEKEELAQMNKYAYKYDLQNGEAEFQSSSQASNKGRSGKSKSRRRTKSPMDHQMKEQQQVNLGPKDDFLEDEVSMSLEVNSQNTRKAQFNGSDVDSEDDEMKTETIPAAQLRNQKAKNPNLTSQNLAVFDRELVEIQAKQEKCFSVKQYLLQNPISSAFLKREKGRLPYSVFKASNDSVCFLKSTFKGRPPTVFFNYPTYVQNDKSKYHNMEQVKKYHRRGDIEYLFMSFLNSDRTHIYNAVVNTMKHGGFEMIERGQDFNLVWTGYTTITDILALNKYQKVNHFPESVNLGRKDKLWRNILRMKIKYPEQFNVTPHSWIMPDAHEEFEQIREYRVAQKQFFILKPTNSSCGRGIKVIQGNSNLGKLDETIISSYIERPLLINKKKFDMRMYVAVTSFHPLRAYIYSEGLARFATEDYSNDPKILKNKFVHLTNFSINKKNQKNYVKNDNKNGDGGMRNKSAARDAEEDPEEENSSKWSLHFLRKYLTKMLANQGKRVTSEDLFKACHDIIIKTLLSVEKPIVTELNKVGNRQRCCFEIYGFDIIFDDHLKPWVLEVNCLPSLSSSSVFDKQVKTQLICDAFTLIGIRGYDKNVFRTQKQSSSEEAPEFNSTMTLEEIEEIGGCSTVYPRNPEDSRESTWRRFAKYGYDDRREDIIDSGEALGQGTGFSSDTLLSKDELNLILDLEDEKERTGQFQIIYPAPSTASIYYSYMEERRYQNALYCAWLSTAQKTKRQIIKNCQTQFHSKN